MLLFNEEEHRYFWRDAPEKVLTSVSKVIGQYHEEFDKKAKSESSAKKKGTTPEILLEEWAEKNRKSVERGKAYHLFREEEAYKDKKKKTYKHGESNGLKEAFDITKLQQGVYPELMLYLPEFDLTGTADYVEIFDDKTFILEDYKTNEKLEFSGYMVFDTESKTRKEKKMFTPVNHLPDCKGFHYTLQLSIYAYMLEQAGYKLRPNGLTILHVLFSEEKAFEVVKYPVNYLKKEVIALLNHFKNAKSTHNKRK
jgi:hypothetical protein